MSAYTIGASPAVFRSCPVHSHESWELVINTQGSGTAEINGKKYAFQPGTLMCIPPRLRHNKYAEEMCIRDRGLCGGGEFSSVYRYLCQQEACKNGR